jgi:hypothetical protein
LTSISSSYETCSTTGEAGRFTDGAFFGDALGGVFLADFVYFGEGFGCFSIFLALGSFGGGVETFLGCF